ncbi:hypothetical protein [uncultured Campylobacter sp.]|uniref:hypothetical protein n=1 Tax=uncultured Campylobacter sp. TaxID=218934 RepID=UPI002619F07A|nr:hypothetical protein [uncultured Campylobacter sp.]
MENLLLAQLREVLPQGMRVPSEIQALYAWIEANGFYDDVGGRRRAISTHRIGCSRVGATMSARAARTSYFSRMSRKIATRS